MGNLFAMFLKHTILHNLLHQLIFVLQSVTRKDVQNMNGTYEFIKHQCS